VTAERSDAQRAPLQQCHSERRRRISNIFCSNRRAGKAAHKECCTSFCAIY